MPLTIFLLLNHVLPFTQQLRTLPLLWDRCDLNVKHMQTEQFMWSSSSSGIWSVTVSHSVKE